MEKYFIYCFIFILTKFFTQQLGNIKFWGITVFRWL